MSNSIPDPEFSQADCENTLEPALNRCLVRAINASCRSGPSAVAMLTGDPKAIIVPHWGELNAKGYAVDFDLARGDGHPILSHPGDVTYQTPPYVNPAPNIRAAVPTWVLNAPDLASLLNGKATVLAVGYIHPSRRTALIDRYRSGHFVHRSHVFDSTMPLSELMRIDLPAVWADLEAIGAGGVSIIPPVVTPEWKPQRAKLFRLPR